MVITIFLVVATSLLALPIKDCRKHDPTSKYRATRALRTTGSFRDALQSTTKIKGVVVAYDNGIELHMGGPCRRTIIFRVKSPQRFANRYVILRSDGSCMNPIPEKTLNQRRTRSLVAVSSPECDQPLDELLYFRQINETGTVTREDRLKSVPGEDLKKISTTHKLPCYLIQAGFP
jgi:hypothetical protein